MRSYNGHSPEKRLAVLRWLTEQWNRGILPRPDHCTACLRTTGTIQGHNEDYDRPTNYIGICNVCHLMIHCRFRNLTRWHRYRDMIRQGYQPPPKSHTEAFGFLRSTYLAGRFDTLTLVNPPRDWTVLDDLPDREIGSPTPPEPLF